MNMRRRRLFLEFLVAPVLGLLIVGCTSIPRVKPPAPAQIHPPVQQPEVVPTPPAPPPAPLYSFREVVAVQTLLDRSNFSCGCIDGKFGPRTRMALEAWQKQKRLPVSGKIDEATRERAGDPERFFTTHVVTSNELAALTPVPQGWVGKSRAVRLDYETILETVAEKYHAAEQAIRDLNPDTPWPDPPAGTVLQVPDPKSGPVKPAASLTISLGRKTIRAYDTNGTLIALFPCSIAKDKEKRPLGLLQVQNCADNPNYYFDPALFAEDPDARSLTKRLVIPPGPNNPVGIAWISLDRPGYGIHGTPRPEDIGKTESHGCFRLANWNAGKLMKMISIGTPVKVEE